MDGLKISMIMVSMILLLLPGAYGLDFSMGTSNGIKGASESIKLNAPLESSIISSTEACPNMHVTGIMIKGSGAYEFDQTFDSLNKGEHVRLAVSMEDSKNFIHGYQIEKQKKDSIKVSQSLTVNQGKKIECSAEAWNSRGQAAMVGLKISEGSLTDYRSYGDATDDKVVADQKAIIPEKTRFAVFTEAEQKIANQKSMCLVSSSKALDIETTSTVKQKKSTISNKLSINKGHDSRDEDDEDDEKD